MSKSQRVLILLIGAAGLVLAGMTGGVGADVAMAKPKKVRVVLSEWIVKPKPKTVKSGRVNVVAKNLGSEDHELVIVEGDDPEALPTDENGAVIEEELEDIEVGEIEDVESRSSKSKKFRLEPGTYVIFCNITEEEEDGTIESHFAEGMHNTLKVG